MIQEKNSKNSSNTLKIKTNYLDLLNNYLKDRQIIEHHPMKEASLEEKDIYLKAIVMVMGVDGVILEQEKDYFCLLAKSIDMSEAIEEYIKFASNVTTDFIEPLSKFLEKNDEAESFFISDCYIMAYCDGQFHKKEKEILSFFNKLIKLNMTKVDKVKSFFSVLFGSKSSKRDIDNKLNSMGELSKSLKQQLEILSFLEPSAKSKKDTEHEKTSKKKSVFGEGHSSWDIIKKNFGC